MAKAKSKLAEKGEEYIKENLFKQDPEGLPVSEDISEKIVIVKDLPKMKRIVFLNGRDPGQELMFSYHSKTCPMKRYTLFHGKEYELPEEVIDHLENCAENQYGYRAGPNGHPEMYVKGKKYVFSCKPVRG
jgi:hypothetical protein